MKNKKSWLNSSLEAAPRSKPKVKAFEEPIGTLSPISFELSNKEEVHKNLTEIKNRGFSHENLYIKEVQGKGLGVFSKTDIPSGEIVEMCHAIVFDWRAKYHKDPSISQYAYWDNCQCDECKRHGKLGMILLGNGSVYNSAPRKEEKNVDFIIYAKSKMGMFVSQKDIKAHEEILTWWGEGYYNNWCKPNDKNAN